VVADALTSVLAIGALVLGRYAGIAELDAITGIVGGVVITVWAVGLMRQAGRTLLDVMPSRAHEQRVRAQLEAIDDVRVADLHVWELGPGRRGCVVSLVTSTPRPVETYKRAILDRVAIEHLTIEVHCCTRGHGPAPAPAQGPAAAA
jgi:Co/Zn/Cd efflux system component